MSDMGLTEDARDYIYMGLVILSIVGYIIFGLLEKRERQELILEGIRHAYDISEVDAPQGGIFSSDKLEMPIVFKRVPLKILWRYSPKESKNNNYFEVKISDQKDDRIYTNERLSMEVKTPAVSRKNDFRLEVLAEDEVKVSRIQQGRGSMWHRMRFKGRNPKVEQLLLSHNAQELMKALGKFGKFYVVQHNGLFRIHYVHLFDKKDCGQVAYRLCICGLALFSTIAQGMIAIDSRWRRVHVVPYQDLGLDDSYGECEDPYGMDVDLDDVLSGDDGLHEDAAQSGPSDDIYGDMDVGPENGDGSFSEDDHQLPSQRAAMGDEDWDEESRDRAWGRELGQRPDAARVDDRFALPAATPELDSSSQSLSVGTRERG